MKSPKNFESCLTPYLAGHHTSSPYEWLINQNHIPFDMSSDAHGMYYTMYHEFLDELYELHHQMNMNYYWYSTNNKLATSRNGDETIINENHIKIDKQKLRELKIKEIIDNE